MAPRVPTKSPGSIQSLQLPALDFVPLVKPVAPSFRPRWKYLRSTWQLGPSQSSNLSTSSTVYSLQYLLPFFYFFFSSHLFCTKNWKFGHPLFLQPLASLFPRLVKQLRHCDWAPEESEYFGIEQKAKLWDFPSPETFFSSPSLQIDLYHEIDEVLMVMFFMHAFVSNTTFVLIRLVICASCFMYSSFFFGNS